MQKEEIDKQYLDQASVLEAEFFDFVDEGLPSQHRVLKTGKSIDEFNLRHGNIWREHETDLVTAGLMEAPKPFVFEVDWKGEWLLADTVAKKLVVIARRLELL